MPLVPSFEKHHILKAEMLEALRDNPVDFMDTLFEGYSDGIIDGFTVSVDDDVQMFKISSGILKIQGKVSVVRGPLSVAVKNGQNIVYLDVTEDKNEKGTELSFSVRNELNESNELDSQIELFRCYKSETSRISLPRTFNEVFVEASNTINYAHSPRSIKGGSSLRSEVFEVFAEELLAKIAINAKDIAFAYKCLDGISNISVVRSYFAFEGQCLNKDLIKKMYAKLESSNNLVVAQNEEQRIKKRPQIDIE